MKQLYPLVTALLLCPSLLFAQPRHPFIWQKCLGDSGDEQARDVVVYADETAVVVGSANSTDGDVTGYHRNNDYTTDGWVVKIDTDGNIIWQKAVGGSSNDQLMFVRPGSNNSCYCIGYTSSTDGDVPAIPGDNKLWIIQLDSSGNILWSKVYDSLQAPSDVILLPGNNLAVLANAVVKISAQGDLLWKKNIFPSAGNYLAAYGAGTIVTSGGYFLRSIDGAYTQHNWNFSTEYLSSLKSIGDTLFFENDQFVSNTPCNNIIHKLITLTDTSGVYTENIWQVDCMDKYGDFQTLLPGSTSLSILSSNKFITAGKTVSPFDYMSSAFFYFNGFFSEYGTNMEEFISSKAYPGERTFLCVGKTSSYDDWDFQGNHNVATSDMLIVKLAGLTNGNWTGIKSADWNDKDNWSNHEVPYMGTIVTIPAGTPNNPVVNNNAACYSIKLEPGATINVSDGIKLKITGRKRIY